MTLRQKYKSLSDPVFVKEMIVNSVYSTMKLEGQDVSKEKIEELYNQEVNKKVAAKEPLKR